MEGHFHLTCCCLFVQSNFQEYLRQIDERIKYSSSLGAL